MTIAIGMLATDGIVLAADTQVGITDYLKTSQGKIAMIVIRNERPDMPLRSFAVTGAGNASYLEALRHRMTDLFRDPGYSEAPGRLETDLEERLIEFYDAHVVPFDQYPANERPDFWLLMGAQFGEQKLLWTTEKNVLIPHSQSAAVGIGAMYAQILLSRFHAKADSRTTALLAAYVIFQVKESIDGCGRDTDIFVLRRGTPFFLDRQRVRALEELFREYSKVESRILIHALGGSPPPELGGRSVFESVERVREAITKLFGPAGQRYHQPTTADPSPQPPSQVSPEEFGES
jgi:hypothetical protein